MALPQGGDSGDALRLTSAGCVLKARASLEDKTVAFVRNVLRPCILCAWRKGPRKNRERCSFLLLVKGKQNVQTGEESTGDVRDRTSPVAFLAGFYCSS